MNIIQSPSPNFYGRSGNKPEMIVVHCTDGYWPSDRDWLRNPASVVSSHFVVSPEGEIHQLVDVENGAWHAGRIDKPTAKLKKTVLGGYINPNLYTIGIEVSLRPPLTMPTAQKESLIDLIKTMCAKYSIPMDRAHIIGHREIYSLKTCPGTINVDDLVKDLQPVSVIQETKEDIREQILNLLDKLL